MIIREFHWLLLLSLHLVTTITAQDGKSYDPNDWIPITPANPPEKTQKPQSRVLNLDAPNQNFFAENDYSRKRPGVQQYLHETVIPKNPNVRHPKPEPPYKFEPVLPLQPPQYIPQNQYIQQSQVAQQVPYVPPVQQPVLSQQLVAPPESNQNYYNANKAQQNIAPVNNTPSYYQPANVAPLTQELLGEIQHHPINSVPITTTTTTQPKEEKQSVQLLYVPLENLKPTQQVSPQPTIYRRTETPHKERQIPRIQNHKQNQLTNIEDDFISQALAAHKLQQQFQLGHHVVLQTTTTTTPKPKKRKPNQPPLAVYMEKQGAADVKDVLDVLKHAKSISVQDSVGPSSPQVFVGPSTLDPDGYAKFPLPYLSNVQGNRIERKVEELPFFVAPLSYKTPDGYSKIPLPSPHVGSVVVSTKEQLHEKHPEIRQPQTAQNQIVQDFDVKQPFGPFANQPGPNPYLLPQNAPQNNQNAVLGFGNDFLGTFPGNAPQNYEVNTQKRFPDEDYQGNTKEDNPDENYQQFPTRNFAPTYRLGLRQNSPDYYETTPSYNTDEKPITRNNYQVPEYPVRNREAPNQDSKEVIQDYDIPTIPVESKTSYTPNYRFEEKPQISQIQNFETPRTETDVYTYSEEPIKQTTTTTHKPVPVVTQNQYRFTQNPQNQYRDPAYNHRTTSQVDPLHRVINQYEIEQINSQLGEEKTEAIPVEPVRTTTPAVVSTQRYRDDVSTTIRSRGRARHRGRTTTTTSTTPKVLVDENYTILEEFALQPKTTTAKYTTEVETIPAKVYKLDPQPPQTTYIQNQPPIVQQPSFRQNQATSRANYNQPPEQQQYFQGQFPVIQHQPTFVQKEAPIIQNQTPLKQHVLNQEVLDRQILQHKSTPEPELPVTIEPRLTPLVYNRGQNSEEEEQLPPVSPYLPGLINNLQDQAVRPLLVPNLLVPTTEKVTTIAPQPQTEEIRVVTTTTTTEAPTTTTRRSRGRQRAHTSRQSSTSAPRRTVSRRRPNYTRPTTERAVTETSNYEPTRRTGNQRQRFRTRGRPISREQPATERVLQTTQTVFKQPQLEGGFQASSGDPQSYMQFDHVIDNQQVITIKPEQLNEETPMKEYHQIYSLPSQTASPERAQEEIITTPRPVVDVKITHPVTDRFPQSVIATTPTSDDDPRYTRVNSNLQSAGVYNNRNEEVSSRAPVRGRVRSRTRSRFSSTTPRTATIRTTTTTTAKPQEEEEEEFYGFIRKPAYNKPAPVYTTTQQPLPLYSSSYQQSPRTVIQLEDEGRNENDETSSPSPVQFVGQIRPKYTTTEAQEYSTEAPKVIRQRARIRVPSRKVASHQQQSYNEVKPHRYDDQVTRRSSVVRSRSRGSSHYKPPESLSQKKDDHDVEGGNYPGNYLKQLTTEKPSAFQITVDPSEEQDEDQVPHSSLYSPQIIRNEDMEWIEASVLPPPNELQIEEKQMFAVSSEEQTTMPYDEIEEEQTETEQPEEEILTTTDPVETTTLKRRKIGRRRGMWRLVKQKPVDSFETAESQNYFAVLNAFDQIIKKGNKYSTETSTTSTTLAPTTTTPIPTTTSTTTTTTTTTTVSPTTRRRTTPTTETSIFEAIYSMLGLASKASQVPEIKIKPKEKLIKEEITTTTASPTFPEEYTEETTTQEIKNTEESHNEETTTAPPTTTEIKTSTSTEISHETEICYKGKCVKSKEKETIL